MVRARVAGQNIPVHQAVCLSVCCASVDVVVTVADRYVGFEADVQAAVDALPSLKLVRVCPDNQHRTSIPLTGRFTPVPEAVASYVPFTKADEEHNLAADPTAAAAAAAAAAGGDDSGANSNSGSSNNSNNNDEEDDDDEDDDESSEEGDLDEAEVQVRTYIRIWLLFFIR